MTALAPAHQHVDALIAIFEDISAEGAMEITVEKESAHIASDGRSARAGKPPTGRWAILDDDRVVVGYLTGRLGGQIPDIDVAGAFVSQIMVSSSARRAGHGWLALREFARRAIADTGVTRIGLRLDESGDVLQRRGRFERMGFKFTGLIGTMTIEDLLSAQEVI